MHRCVLLLLAVAACGGPRAPAASGSDGVAEQPAPERGRVSQDVGTLLYLGVEMPDAGSVVGAIYGGAAFDVRQHSYQLTEAVRAGWSRAARLRGEALLHYAGYEVRAVGGPTSDVVMVEDDVRFGLQGRVQVLDIRTRAGAGGRSDARAEVSWELLDVVRGTVMFGRTVEGQARGLPTLEDAAFDAFDDALRGLLADSLYQRALREPRVIGDLTAGAAADLLIGSGEMIVISADDINPSADSGAAARVAAGLVTLRSSSQSHGTAFVLTRSGLALTSLRATNQVRRLRVRLPSGVVRPARVLRSHSGLDVALIQVACPEACVTVDWTAELPEVNSDVVTVGAPTEDVLDPLVSLARLGGRWGLASGVTLDVQSINVINGGEPVALAASGKVVAMVSSRPGRRTAMLLGELLRTLRVVPPLPRSD